MASTNKLLEDIRDGSGGSGGGTIVIPMTYSEEHVVADDSYDCTVILDATYNDVKAAIDSGKPIIFTMDFNDDYAGVREIIPTEVSAYHYYDDSPSEYEVAITMADLSRRGPFPIRGYTFVQNANQKLEATFNVGGDK